MKLRTTLATALLALCALLACAGTAGAAPAKVPPGNSGATQYTETLPGVGGNKTTKGLHEGENGGGESSLSADKAAQLEKLGKEGKDAARLAAGGAPPKQAGGKGEGSSTSGDASGAEQVVGAATGASDSGGMGLLLPLLIAAGVLAALGFLGFLVYRRRYAPLPPEGD